MTGADLKARRGALGLSQAQLAARLGVALDTLQNWEQGRRNMAAVAGLVDRALSMVEQDSGGHRFSSINDVYAEFESYFGSEPCEWTRDQLQDWLQGNGHTRYEDIDAAILDAAYAACIAEITDPA